MKDGDSYEFSGLERLHPHQRAGASILVFGSVALTTALANRDVV